MEAATAGGSAKKAGVFMEMESSSSSNTASGAESATTVHVPAYLTADFYGMGTRAESACGLAHAVSGRLTPAAQRAALEASHSTHTGEANAFLALDDRICESAPAGGEMHPQTAQPVPAVFAELGEAVSTGTSELYTRSQDDEGMQSHMEELSRFRASLDYGIDGTAAPELMLDAFLMKGGMNGGHEDKFDANDVADSIIHRVESALPELKQTRPLLASPNEARVRQRVNREEYPGGGEGWRGDTAKHLEDSVAGEDHVAHLPRFRSVPPGSHPQQQQRTHASQQLHEGEATAGVVTSDASAAVLDQVTQATQALAASLHSLREASYHTDKVFDGVNRAYEQPGLEHGGSLHSMHFRDTATRNGVMDELLAGVNSKPQEQHDFRQSLMSVVHSGAEYTPASLRSNDVVSAIDSAVEATSFSGDRMQAAVAAAHGLDGAERRAQQLNSGVSTRLAQQAALEGHLSAATDSYESAAALHPPPAYTGNKKRNRSPRSASRSRTLDPTFGGARTTQAAVADDSLSMDEEFARSAEVAVRADLRSSSNQPAAPAFIQLSQSSKRRSAATVVAAPPLSEGRMDVNDALFDADLSDAMDAARSTEETLNALSQPQRHTTGTAASVPHPRFATGEQGGSPGASQLDNLALDTNGLSEAEADLQREAAAQETAHIHEEVVALGTTEPRSQLGAEQPKARFSTGTSFHQSGSSGQEQQGGAAVDGSIPGLEETTKALDGAASSIIARGADAIASGLSAHAGEVGGAAGDALGSAAAAGINAGGAAVARGTRAAGDALSAGIRAGVPMLADAAATGMTAAADAAEAAERGLNAATRVVGDVADKAQEAYNKLAPKVRAAYDKAAPIVAAAARQAAKATGKAAKQGALLASKGLDAAFDKLDSFDATSLVKEEASDTWGGLEPPVGLYPERGACTHVP